MKKGIYLFILIIMFLGGCGSQDIAYENNSSEKTSSIDSAYEGYIKDSNGTKSFFRVLIVADLIDVQELDKDGNQTLYTGSFNSDKTQISFKNFNCSINDSTLQCDEFSLYKIKVASITINEMAGIYESFGYQLTISTIPNPDDPRVVIIVPNSSCRIEGTVTLAEALPVFKLQNITATGCPTDANVTAIGLFSKLYGGHGILNLAITSDNKLPKYWVKY